MADVRAELVACVWRLSGLCDWESDDALTSLGRPEAGPTTDPFGDLSGYRSFHVLGVPKWDLYFGNRGQHARW